MRDVSNPHSRGYPREDNMFITKTLWLLIIFVSSVYGDYGIDVFNFKSEPATGLTVSKFLKDCEDCNQPFIVDETHDSYETVLILKTFKWKIKLYNDTTTYLNSTIIADVHDLINGDCFKDAVFKDDYCNWSRARSTCLSSEEKHFVKKIEMIRKKFEDLSTVLNSTYKEDPKTVQFPSQLKICTSRCSRRADLCLHLEKIG